MRIVSPAKYQMARRYPPAGVVFATNPQPPREVENPKAFIATRPIFGYVSK